MKIWITKTTVREVIRGKFSGWRRGIKDDWKKHIDKMVDQMGLKVINNKGSVVKISEYMEIEELGWRKDNREMHLKMDVAKGN